MAVEGGKKRQSLAVAPPPPPPPYREAEAVRSEAAALESNSSIVVIYNSKYNWINHFIAVYVCVHLLFHSSLEAAAAGRRWLARTTQHLRLETRALAHSRHSRISGIRL